MGLGARRPKPNLRQGFDRDVYTVLKKLEETNGCIFKTISQAYDAIKKSNSSVARQKRKPIEDALERVLAFRREEERESDSEAELDDAPPPKPEDERFLLNRQMTKLWRDEPAPGTPGATTPTASTPGADPMNNADARPAKKRRIQENGQDREAKESGADTTEKPDKALQKRTPKPSRFQVETSIEGPDLGGVDEILAQLLDYMPHMRMPDWNERNLGRPVPGIVLSGSRGVGKRSLIQKLASKLDVPVISIASCFNEPERLEKSLTEAVDEALRLAPSIIFIENLHSYLPKPSSSSSGSDGNRKAMMHFQQQMRRIASERLAGGPVLAMATTSAITEVDPEALQADLFSSVVQIRIPDLVCRREIIKVLTKDKRMGEDIDFEQLAKRTHGFVAADLVDIVTLAQNVPVNRHLATQERDRNAMEIGDIIIDVKDDENPEDDLEPVKMADFEQVLKDYIPSLRQEGFTAIPSVLWDQVGALTNVRRRLHTSIIGPIRDPDFYSSFGLSRSAGVLLWGPPGCGKTLVAQAVANEAQASFILINGPELLNKYVGESERAVRDLFQRARSSTPCILFFDEIDSIVPRRDGAGTEASTRVVNALLTEMDGVRDRSGIFVMGTTNRPDMIDEAMLRPGRLSERLFVDLPTEDERVDILRTIYRTTHKIITTPSTTLPADTAAEIASLEGIARDPRCENFSGADLSGLHIKAAQHAVERYVFGENAAKAITAEDWEYALANTLPSVPHPEIYRSLNEKGATEKPRKSGGRKMGV